MPPEPGWFARQCMQIWDNLIVVTISPDCHVVAEQVDQGPFPKKFRAITYSYTDYNSAVRALDELSKCVALTDLHWAIRANLRR